MTDTMAPLTGDWDIEIDGLSISLGRSGSDQVVFHLPELRIARGERFALTGPSGCGKSTLLNAISGLVAPDTGTLKVAGTDVSRLSKAQLDAFRGATIGFVFQSFNLLDSFSALENVLIGMRFGRSVKKADRRERARSLLDEVGLSHRVHAKPATMSVGERQRIAIARALANRPRVLLADEPTGSLDPQTGQEIFALIQEVCEIEGCTLLFVTHDLELAARLPRQFDCRGLIRHEALKDRAAA
ncbi:MAG: ABC transporter ATP-binding protein [Sumerlaeia bacterium]